MGVHTAIAIGLELCSTTLVNVAYVRERIAAASLPSLSLRRPAQSARRLLSDRAWLQGFSLETSGFALYVAALALAPLAIIQSVGAGGLGVLAYASARASRRRLGRREVVGAVISMIGLLALAASLAGTGGRGHRAAILPILLWLASTVVLAAWLVVGGRRLLGVAPAYAVAGGLLFSVGDISTKLTTQGGVRLLFAFGMVAGYALGTSLLQVGYQRAGALMVAGVATLLTNAVPIAAATTVLDEPVPRGVLGGLRVFAFAAVTAGAILLARPQTTGRAA